MNYFILINNSLIMMINYNYKIQWMIYNNQLYQSKMKNNIKKIIKIRLLTLNRGNMIFREFM